MKYIFEKKIENVFKNCDSSWILISVTDFTKTANTIFQYLGPMGKCIKHLPNSQQHNIQNVDKIIYNIDKYSLFFSSVVK